MPRLWFLTLPDAGTPMKKLGRYDLTRVIGKGAMGMVYEARDPNLDRRVAIKTIKVENLSEEEAVDYELRFRTEARSAARLQHPNIVSVYDSDRDSEVAYLVIEYINGEDLKHHLDRGDVYTLAQTLSIMGDLLSALDYAHRNGIVHRDIKPANLLLEPGGRVKLADFGVARMQDSGDATRTQGSMVGTLKYMSPEQVQSQPVDARADLFAAGIVLYQLLTGVRPFDGSSDFDVIQKITSQNPLPPSSLTPGLPQAIDAVVARALEKSRENRYPTAQAFKEALFAAVHDTDTDQTVAPRTKAPGSRSPLATENTGGGSASGATSTVTQELELVYWKDITESSDRADFVGFLERFPAGVYADLAKRKLKRLGMVDGSGASLAPATQTRPVDNSVTQVSARGSALAVSPSAAATAAPDVPPSPSAAPAATGSERTLAPGRHRWLGAVVALAVVGAGMVGYGLWPGDTAHEEQVVSAPIAPSSQVPSAASAAQSVNVPGPVAAPAASTGTLAESVAPATAVVGKPGLSTGAAHPASSASAAVVPKLAASARQTPEHVKGAEPALSAVAGSKTPPAATAAAANDPRVPCKDRWLLGYQLCMSRKCGEAVYAQHPVCVERHEMERNNRSREKSTF